MAIMRCKSPFTAWTNGVPRTVTGGELIEDTDPVYAGREAHFEPAEAAVTRTSQVEQATAAPGEKRSVSTRGRAKRAAGESDKAK